MGGLGFRDMMIFNQAMLGHQRWQLLTESNSLCAKVLKGRYYPNCSFTDSGPTRSSSFTWRSLMHGKSLLDRGLLWWVGNGEEIRVTKDRWIPDAPCHPILPIVQMPNDLKVGMKSVWVLSSDCPTKRVQRLNSIDRIYTEYSISISYLYSNIQVGYMMC